MKTEGPKFSSEIEQAGLSPVKRALLAVKTLQAKVAALEQAKTEPIAIVGIGCRFPYDTDTPEKFWEMLRNGQASFREVPPERWDVEAYYHPKKEGLPPGTTYTRKGSFLSEVDQFDAHFFGISGREARKMDPQQRMLLEVGWEAFERAGFTDTQLMGSKTGVFLGISTQDYYHIASNPIGQNDMYAMSGNNISVAAGRLAYVWGLTGPTLAIDTSCSSSLVAVHLALQSLRARECDQALAGGVALMLTPHFTIQMAHAGALSPASLCQAFSASADGYSQGEGCGLVVLKRLSDALRDEDNIVAVIRGSAINHDGRSSGLTVPNAIAQQNVIQQACVNSGVEPADVDYVEAHGTGTSVGDVIEVEALAAVFAGRTRPVLIGSVKSNIGHLDSAAGVAGLIKTALALQQREIPPHLHCRELNPRIDWAASPVRVATSLQSFPQHARSCLAGVSAFGVSGTNSHVILEEAPLREHTVVAAAKERDRHLLNLSAKTADALRALAGRYQAFLREQPDSALGDIAYTANHARSHFAHRLSVSAASSAEMAAKLESYCRAEPESGVQQGYVSESQGKRRVAYFFPGDALEHWRMGHGLYQTQPAFRGAVDQCAKIFDRHLERWLLSVMFEDDSEPGQTGFSRAAVFTLEFALAALWQSWGIQPDFVAGSGMGEYAAVCLAGKYSVEEAASLAVARGRVAKSSRANAIPYAAVRPADAATIIEENNIQVVVEIGPNCCNWQSLFETLSRLYVEGVAVDWRAFDKDSRRCKVVLPTYPWQRQRYWVEGLPPKSRAQGLSPLIDRRIHVARHRETLFEKLFSREALPIVLDHRIGGAVVAPAACHLSMVLSIAAFEDRSDSGTEACVISDVVFPSPLVIPEEVSRTVQVVCSPAGAETKFELVSFDEEAPGEVATHASGSFAREPLRSPTVSLEELRGRCAAEVDRSAFYQIFTDKGFTFGPGFRWVEQVWQGKGEAVALLRRPDGVEFDEYVLHPGLLDACTQVPFAISLGSAPPKPEATVPFALSRLRCYRPASGEAWWVHATETGRYTWDVSLFDETGCIVAEFAGLEDRSTESAITHDVEPWRRWLFTVNWQAQPLAAPQGFRVDRGAAETWLVFGKPEGLGVELATYLHRDGKRCVFILPGRDYTVRERKIAGESTAAVTVATLNPASADDLKKLVATGIDREFPCRRVFYQWTPDDVATALGVTVDEGMPDVVLHLYGGMLHVVQAFNGVQPAPQLCIVTEASQAVGDDAGKSQLGQAPLWALARTIRAEHPEFDCRCVDLETLSTGAELLLRELRATDGEPQVAYREGIRYVARLMPDPPSKRLERDSQPSRLRLSDYGSSGYLHSVAAERRLPGPREIEVEVNAAGLNFRDVMNVLGMLKTEYAERYQIQAAPDVPLGLECSGIVTAIGKNITGVAVGDRVMALAEGAFANYVTIDSRYAAKVPAGLTFEQAATIPLAFLTAFLGLNRLAELRAGEKVLIHAAAGGVGQAAVQLARAAGAEVYCTASRGKWDFLRAQGITHIYDSRTLEFADSILRDTNGHGVNVVLNSLAGDFIRRSAGVLAKGGRFVELGRVGIWTSGQMQALRDDVAYYPFDAMENQTADAIGEALAEFVAKFADGSLKPLPSRVFPAEEAAEAVRHMQQAKHRGKIVLSFALPRQVEIRGDAAYLITGGLGGLGLQAAQSFAGAGAKHLILNSRHGAVTTEAQLVLGRLRQQGVSVEVIAADASIEAECQRLLAACEKNVRLRGILHAAGVLDDGILSRQTLARFETVMAPKVRAAWRLHQQSLALDLDFFIAFSSAGALIEEPGQGNYGAANAFLDSLMRYRHAQGSNSLTINWGPWADVGMAARARFRQPGVTAIPPAEGGSLLIKLIQELNRNSNPQVVVQPTNWTEFLSQPAAMNAPFYRGLVQPSARESGSGRKQPSDAPADSGSLGRRLPMLPERERSTLLMQHLQTTAVAVLGLADGENLDSHQGLMNMGMDSLMAVEFRNLLTSTLECSLPATLLFNYPTLSSLHAYLAGKLRDAEGPAQGTPSACGEGADARQDDEESVAEIARVLAEALDAAQ